MTEARSEVLHLINKRDLIEKEIKEMGAILQQNGIGMTDPLVDSEGFPLQNIDVYQVRLARNRIICLQNDHKAIMKEIENGLGTYYASVGNTNSAPEMTNTSNADYTNVEPFAKIGNVAPTSPADEAGLRNNDLVLEFGSINATNFKDVNTIGDIVKHSENINLRVAVRRDNRNITLNLRPRKWTGKGLLGCIITPLYNVDR